MHYCILVVGEDIDGQMEPYEQFECTGRESRFVQDLDITEEVKAEYEAYKAEYVQLPLTNSQAVMSPSGKRRVWAHPTLGLVMDKYDDVFWRRKPDTVGFGSNTHDFVLPEGCTVHSGLFKDTRTLAEFAEYYHDIAIMTAPYDPKLPANLNTERGEQPAGKYGYALVHPNGEIQVIKRTNPDYKWDGYQLGGRYSDRFKFLPAAEARTRRGYDRYRTEPRRAGYTDSLLKGDIDFEGMQRDQAQAAQALYEKYHRLMAGQPRLYEWCEYRKALKARQDVVGGQEVEGLDEYFLTVPLEEAQAREHYRAQPGLAVLNASEDDELRWLTWNTGIICTLYGPVAEFAQYYALSEMCTYGFVINGVWIERDENNGERADWFPKWLEIFNNIPNDVRVSVIDIHV